MCIVAVIHLGVNCRLTLTLSRKAGGVHPEHVEWRTGTLKVNGVVSGLLLSFGLPRILLGLGLGVF